jgi:DNA-binding LytR/AlgR family response regulator
MTILIIEDEPMAANHLQRLIHLIAPEAKLLGQPDSIKSAVRWLNENNAPDLIFMDIQLGDGKSFQIFEQCTVSSPVIFITAYDEYALKAFKVNSIDYILKPVDEKELRAAILKFKNLNPARPVNQDKIMESLQQAVQMLSKKHKERFVIKVGEHLRSIETKDLLFFFSQEKTTFAQSVDGRKHILDNTLDQLETVLDPTLFFRISRKYIVGVNSIHDMISYTNSRLKLVLKTSDDKDVIVARERVQEFKQWLDR